MEVQSLIHVYFIAAAAVTVTLIMWFNDKD
jgi:hypothetical protein